MNTSLGDAIAVAASSQVTMTSTLSSAMTGLSLKCLRWHGWRALGDGCMFSVWDTKCCTKNHGKWHPSPVAMEMGWCSYNWYILILVAWTTITSLDLDTFGHFGDECCYLYSIHGADGSPGCLSQGFPELPSGFHHELMADVAATSFFIDAWVNSHCFVLSFIDIEWFQSDFKLESRATWREAALSYFKWHEMARLCQANILQVEKDQDQIPENGESQ